MKRSILILIALAGLVAIAASLPPSLALSASVTGVPTKDEKRMMIWLIQKANETITATNGTALPFSTGPERKASYEVVLGYKLAEMHQNNLNAAASAAAATSVITGDNMDKITQAIIDRIQSGESIDTIITDVQQ